MERILFLAHVEGDGSLGKPARETLQAAVKLHRDLEGSTLAVGLVGEAVQGAADAVAACGATSFLAVAGSDFAPARYATDAAAAEALVRKADPTLILAPGTSRFARSLPGAAQRVDGRIDTHVTAIGVEENELRAQRWFYRQRMMAIFSRTARPWFLLVEPGGNEPWTGEAGSAVVEEVPVALGDEARRTRVVGEEAATSGPQTIRPDADLLFVAGAGWTKQQPDGKTHVQEAEALIREFLDRTQASLGSSKSLADQSSEGQEVISFLSHLNQVGQTGSSPRHPKGLSTCCHGEEPHVVGWRFIGQRRAINLDPGCGWARGKADVLYVADAFAVIAKVNELLAQG